MPVVEESASALTPALIMHPALFAFGPGAAMKAQPETHVALRLADEFLTHGFITASEPFL